MVVAGTVAAMGEWANGRMLNPHQPCKLGAGYAAVTSCLAATAQPQLHAARAIRLAALVTRPVEAQLLPLHYGQPAKPIRSVSFPVLPKAVKGAVRGKVAPMAPNSLEGALAASPNV